jgi:O-antigen/teichoic acid export membrane protein
MAGAFDACSFKRLLWRTVISKQMELSIKSMQFTKTLYNAVGEYRFATYFKKMSIRKIKLNIYEDKQYQFKAPTSFLDSDIALVDPQEFTTELSHLESGVNIWSMDKSPTWILPTLNIDHTTLSEIETGKIASFKSEGQLSTLRKLIKSSGIYALSSVAVPLISLVLTPFLTHNLSLSEYGIFIILTTAISLMAGFTQLGLGSAFFRAYSYDYTLEDDRRDVVATTMALLCIVSVSTVIIVGVTSPLLANLLLGQSSLGIFVTLAGGVVLVQNLTVPGLAWMRAENRPFFYSLLSISGLVITLLANIVLVGVLHWGVAGSLIANCSGYACIVICTMPMVIFYTGIRLNVDIARNLLTFGIPLVLNYVSYWILQFSDRYLLSLFTTLTVTARYAVSYTLGSAIAVLVIAPFTLAWPTTMFAIAKHKDAVQSFVLVFRWFSAFLLFAAFGLSFVGTFLLYWLFPIAYHSTALIIPVVAESIVFYGIYFVFMIGANLKRKTWLAAVFTTTAALVNLAANLVLIPHYGAMGAAVSTLVAYIVLAIAAYIVNQRIYPIPFEIGRFVVMLLIGVALYIGSSYFAQYMGTYIALSIYMVALTLYAGCLTILGKLPSRSQGHEYKNGFIQKGFVL